MVQSLSNYMISAVLYSPIYYICTEPELCWYCNEQDPYYSNLWLYCDFHPLGWVVWCNGNSMAHSQVTNPQIMHPRCSQFQLLLCQTISVDSMHIFAPKYSISMCLIREPQLKIQCSSHASPSASWKRTKYDAQELPMLHTCSYKLVSQNLAFVMFPENYTRHMEVLVTASLSMLLYVPHQIKFIQV